MHPDTGQTPEANGIPEAVGLQEEVAELRARVVEIEDALRKRGVVLEARVAARTIAPEPTPAQGMLAQAGAQGEEDTSAMDQASTAVPAFASAPTATARDERSLESRIGSQWFNRIGILAVLVAAAWFLKYAIDNHWIGPLGRVLIGLVSGAALIAWSEQFRNKGYAAFSYSLKAVGSGVLYLSLWAAFSMFHLLPATAAFGAMILVTAFNGYMAWAQDAELLALYAIVGGLGTPLLLSTGENHETALLSYLLLLDVATLVLVVLKPWSRLLFGAFTGTVLIGIGWAVGYYSQEQCARTAFFVACFFLIFAFAPRLARPRSEDGAELSGWDVLALVLLPVVNATVGFMGFYILLDQPQTQWAGPWLAVAFAAFYLGMTRLPARGWVRPAPPVLGALHLAAAVVFLTIAIPLKLKNHSLAAIWLAEGTALVWVAARSRNLLLRILGLACLVLGLGALFWADSELTATPVFNARFGTYLVAIAAFGLTAWIAARARKALVEDSQPGGHADAWKAIAFVAALVVSALILLAVSLEIASYWQVRDGQDWRVLEANRVVAQFSYSAWFMLFGAILLAVGFARRSAFLRWQGLVLLAVSVAKVFLLDMDRLSQGYRILSFLGLGALLLGVSFVYQRDWLNLRAAKAAAPAEPEAPAESDQV